MRDGLRVLHLFANYKWTGPADPALRTAARLRALGLDVVFAQAGWTHRGAEHWLAEQLWNRRLPVVTGLQLRKHLRLGALRADVLALRRLVSRDRYDVVHCHLLGDHLTAAVALRRLAERPVLVRSLYEPEPPPRGWRHRLCFARTDGVVAPTQPVAAAMVDRFGLRSDAVLHQEPVVEPRRRQGPDLRRAWGLAAGDFVVGITARIQPHRRFDLLWATARRLADRVPGARLVLLGRGNEVDTARLVQAPVRELGLERSVVLPGYLKEPDYSAALRSLDAFLFLVPGSDGTCRAVREAMAQGLPVVATRRGILPELLRPAAGGAPTGSCHDEDPDQLAAALAALAGDPALRARMGEAALARTRADMDPEAAARRLSAFYGRLAAARSSRVGP